MKTRILVVDDEPDFTAMIKRTLELEGNYEVREENSSRNALGAAREFQPDVVLMDAMMPELSGVEVAESFQEDDQLKKIPVIFLSGLVREIAGPQFGGSLTSKPVFLSKAVPIGSLVASIKKAVPRA